MNEVLFINKYYDTSQLKRSLLVQEELTGHYSGAATSERELTEYSDDVYEGSNKNSRKN